MSSYVTECIRCYKDIDVKRVVVGRIKTIECPWCGFEYDLKIMFMPEGDLKSLKCNKDRMN